MAVFFVLNLNAQTYTQVTTIGDLTDGDYLIVGDGTSNDGLMVNTSSGSVIIDYTAITNPGATISSGYTANNVFQITVSGGNITIYNASAGYASWGRSGVTGNDADFFNGTVANTERWTPTVAGGLWTLRNVSDASRMLQWNNSAPRFVAYTSNQVKLKLYKASVSCTPPTTQPSSVSFSSVNANDMTISWAGGNGTNSLVVIHEGSAVSASPSNSTSYTASTTFGSGDDLGSNNYVVYNGTGSSVTVTGLTANTTYHVAVYEFNSADDCYNTTSPATNSQTTACPTTPNPTTGFVAVAGNGEASLSWTTPSSCFDEVLVIADDGTITHSPSGDGSAYTANSVYGLGSNHGSNEYAVYQGNGTSVTITGLTNGESYCFKIWVRYGTSWSAQEVDCGIVPSITYCDPGSWSSADSEIEDVTLVGENNTISNTTTNVCTDVIQDYTAMSADLEQGGTYTVTVEFGDCDGGSAYDGAGGVWIDWNNDGDFDDANEEIGTADVAVSGGNIIEPFTINVPGGQAIGNYRMRIVQDEGGSAASVDPCNDPGWGSIEDYTIEVISACTPTHTVSSFVPTSGPEGTEVTIVGTGFSGSSTVSFNGQSATIVSQSSTVLVVEVPSGATTGPIVINESACDLSTSDFTIIDESGTCSGGGSFGDLIITEVYDSDANNVWYIELYNPTGSDIDLAADDYEIDRYATAWGSGVSRTIDLTGTVTSGSTFLVNIGSSANTCTETWDFSESGGGINEDDGIMLTKGGVDVDAVICPGNTGYSILRDPSAVGPTATYNAADWTTNNTEACGDLGSFAYVISNPPSVAGTADVSACSADFSVSATAGNGGTLTYQWYFNDSISAGWQTATTANLPAGLTVSGETSNNLVISSNTASTSTIDGYQFYCLVTEDGTCNVASVAAEFRHDPERFYRSTATGDWDDVSTWQMATSTGGPWSAACDYPTATNSDYISIESGNTVTVPEGSSLSGNEIIIQVGGILQLEEGFTIPKEAAGADLVIEGRLNDWGSSAEPINFTGGATWELDANGDIYKYWSSSVINLMNNYEGGISTIPATADWYFHYDGSNQNVIVNTVDMYYPNLYFESSNGHHAWDATSEVFRGSSGYATVKGNLYIGTTSTGTVEVYNNNGNAQAMLVQGNIYVGAGSTFSNADQGVSGGTVGTGMEVLGDMVVDGTYNFDNSNTGVTILSGTAAQEISSTTPGTFNTRDFEIDNSNGADLDGIDVNISNTLTFTDGVLRTDVATTDMFNITNTSTAAIVNGSAQSATNRYIDGRLQWSTTSGNTYRFPVGSDVGTYGAQGFDITIDAGSGAILGYLEANATAPIYNYAYCDFEDHPGVGTNITIGSGNAGYDGILDQAIFDLNSDLQWDITNTSGSVTQYDLTVLATGNQDINPSPHPDNLAVSSNGLEVRYLMKNGEPGNPGVATTSTLDFPNTGFDMCPTQYTLSNLTSFSHFTLDGPSTPQTTLPVELTVFEAKRNGDVVNLSWITESELNASHFVIERSKDGENFQPILSEEAFGNSTSVIDYSSIDYNPLNGKSFYRLQSVDFDGSFEYSDTRMVEFENGNLTVWNNADSWEVLYKSSSNDYLVRVYNNLGQVVKNSHVVQNPEMRSVIFNQDLPSGTYILVVQDGDANHVLKVIK